MGGYFEGEYVVEFFIGPRKNSLGWPRVLTEALVIYLMLQRPGLKRTSSSSPARLITELIGHQPGSGVETFFLSFYLWIIKLDLLEKLGMSDGIFLRVYPFTVFIRHTMSLLPKKEWAGRWTQALRPTIHLGQMSEEDNTESMTLIHARLSSQVELVRQYVVAIIHRIN